jgi:hypothetical protein
VTGEGEQGFRSFHLSGWGFYHIPRPAARLP